MYPKADEQVRRPLDSEVFIGSLLTSLTIVRVFKRIGAVPFFAPHCKTVENLAAIECGDGRGFHRAWWLE